jgi:formylglycine-generating enzyme required for sulfatase activity
MSEMIRIPAGNFRMGSTEFYPEEGPVVERWVGTFDLDKAPVTNEEFARFVAETGHVTVAERPIDPNEFPGAGDVQPGSLTFVATSGPVDLRDWRQWWRWTPGATWRRPFGPDSSIEGKPGHPVVQVAYQDALAYAAWAGKRLPSEAEWEFAGRGGLDGARFAWGDDPQQPGDLRANSWQGHFPYANTGANGWVGTSPVGSFPPNGYGLVDMTGNVWEWTSEPWNDRHADAQACSCSPAPEHPGRQRVLKGGSHLCAPEYCLRYRPAARSSQTEDSSTTHIGFRCARDVA